MHSSNASKPASLPRRREPSMRLLAFFLALAILAGCAHKVSPQRLSEAQSASSFIDLEPGWRLRAIVPLMKSGKAGAPALTVVEQNGLALTLKALPNLIGYETQYYAVEKRWSNLRIEFASASDVRDGLSTKSQEPVIDIFSTHPRARYIRLLYLTRASHNDHNMAVLGAPGPQSLQNLTMRIENDPGACQAANRVFCLWVPAGIALRPEQRASDKEVREWQPVR